MVEWLAMSLMEMVVFGEELVHSIEQENSDP